jgi:hypothetical protein
VLDGAFRAARDARDVRALLPRPGDGHRRARGKDRRAGADRQPQGGGQRPDHELARRRAPVRRPGDRGGLRHLDELRRGERARRVRRRRAGARHRDLGRRPVQAGRSAAQGRADQAGPGDRQEHRGVAAVRHHLRLRRSGGGHHHPDGAGAVPAEPGRGDRHRHRRARPARHRRGQRDRRLRAVAHPHRAAARPRAERGGVTRSGRRPRRRSSRWPGPSRPGRSPARRPSGRRRCRSPRG